MKSKNVKVGGGRTLFGALLFILGCSWLFILAVYGDCGGKVEDDSGRLLSLVGFYLLLLTIWLCTILIGIMILSEVVKVKYY